MLSKGKRAARKLKRACWRQMPAATTRFFLQHPLQMLLIFLSTLESSELSLRMASSPCIAGP
jgi:hypothetical protein